MMSSLGQSHLARSSTAFVLVALLSLLAFSAQASETPKPAELNEEQRAKIEKGEILVEVDQGESINRGVIIGIVQDPLSDVVPLVAQCWEYAAYREVVENTRLEDRVEDEDGVIVCSGTAKTPFPASDRHGHFRVHNRTEHLNGERSFVSTFNYVEDSGNLEDMFGYWVLTPYGPNDEHTLLKHVLNVDIGGWIPSFLIRWATRRTLPGTVTNMRQHLDSEGVREESKDFWQDYSY